MNEYKELLARLRERIECKNDIGLEAICYVALRAVIQERDEILDCDRRNEMLAEDRTIAAEIGQKVANIQLTEVLISEANALARATSAEAKLAHIELETIERCAKVCDEYIGTQANAATLAELIRAQSQLGADHDE